MTPQLIEAILIVFREAAHLLAPHLPVSILREALDAAEARAINRTADEAERLKFLPNGNARILLLASTLLTSTEVQEANSIADAAEAAKFGG